ncbi:hypothetical protein [Flavobacterium sp.]|uniref:hypothetical protein n=1 Tax=Flavobacterium sp. TaxID=239 RepID=UPI00286BE8D7|nr:hypothetical protein [Flavobacterium sp.]
MESTQTFKILFINVIPFAIIVYGIYLSFWTPILKDISNCENKPYSFARAQLMWWTLIIVSSFSAYYGYNNGLPEINKSLLILLGISLGTTTASRIIDNTDINTDKVRHQDSNDEKLFWTNILSDENGISVHRFQALIFNILFGVIFITEFISSAGKVFISFTPTELALMGISSAAYVGIKLNENKTVDK